MWKNLFRLSRPKAVEPPARKAASADSARPKALPGDRAPRRTAATDGTRPPTEGRHATAGEIARTMRAALTAPGEPDAVVATIRQLAATQYRDEPAFVAELVAGFQRSVPVCLRSITELLDHQDFEGIARTARSMKSTSRLLGLEKFSSLCKALEATAGSLPRREAAEPFVEAIRQTYAEVRPILDSERMRILHEAALQT